MTKGIWNSECGSITENPPQGRISAALPLPSPQVNDDEIGESRLRENLRSDDGTFLQEYFVYCKKK
jgi:hypothetical protein